MSCQHTEDQVKNVSEIQVFELPLSLQCADFDSSCISELGTTKTYKLTTDTFILMHEGIKLVIADTILYPLFIHTLGINRKKKEYLVRFDLGLPTSGLAGVLDFSQLNESQEILVKYQE